MDLELPKTADEPCYERASVYHYREDVDFFDWLDPEDCKEKHRSYSAGRWTDGCEQTSVENKYEDFANIIGARPDMKVMDWGCGFGGLTRWLSKHYGCEAHGVSISPGQIAYAKHRAEQEGLNCHYHNTCWTKVPEDVVFDAHTADEFPVHIPGLLKPMWFSKVRNMSDVGAVLALKDICNSCEANAHHEQLNLKLLYGVFKGQCEYVTYPALVSAADPGWCREGSIWYDLDWYRKTSLCWSGRFIPNIKRFREIDPKLCRETHFMLKAYQEIFKQRPRIWSLEMTKFVAVEPNRYD